MLLSKVKKGGGGQSAPLVTRLLTHRIVSSKIETWPGTSPVFVWLKSMCFTCSNALLYSALSAMPMTSIVLIESTTEPPNLRSTGEEHRVLVECVTEEFACLSLSPR
jgi:hypothetical protein